MSTIILDNITVYLDKDQNVTLAKDNLTGKFVSLKIANEILNNSIVICNNVQSKAMFYSIHSMRLFAFVLALFIFMTMLVYKSVKHCLFSLYGVITTCLRLLVSLFNVLAKIKLIDLALFVSSIVLFVLIVSV